MIPLRNVSILNFNRGLVLPDRVTGLAVLRYVRQGTKDLVVDKITPQMRAKERSHDLPNYLQSASALGKNLGVRTNEQMWRQLEAEGRYVAGFCHPELGDMAFSLEQPIPGSDIKTISLVQFGKDRDCPLDAKTQTDCDLVRATGGSCITLEAVALSNDVESLDLAPVFSQLPQIKSFKRRTAEQVALEVAETGGEEDVVVAVSERGALAIDLSFSRFVDDYNESTVYFCAPPLPPGLAEKKRGLSSKDRSGLEALADAFLKLPGFEGPEEQGLQIGYRVFRSDDGLIYEPAEVKRVTTITEQIVKAYQPWVVG